MNYTYTYRSSLGDIVLESDGTFLTRLFFQDKAVLDSLMEGESLHVFRETVNWLDIYFSGREPDFMPRIKAQGSDFSRRVWELTLMIAYGETRTYGELAKIIGEERKIPKMSAQAIARALGQNPIALIIPCHRVLGKESSLTGYRWGIERKRELLKLENKSIELS